MFNIVNVGRKISQLRKNKNMTQMELADRMNVSFQAVSNWERGNSMPDISKLPELANVFGVTIDEIIGEKSELIDSAANGKIGEYLDSNAVTMKQIEEVAPIFKPEQVDEMAEKMKACSINDVMDILPFVSDEVADMLVEKAAEGSDYAGIEDAAPFVSEKTIDRIAGKMAQQGKSIDGIAPYISDNVISELALIIYKKQGLSGIKDILVYISDSQLDSIAELEYDSHGISGIEDFLPYLSEECLDSIAQKALLRDGIKAIRSIAPFRSDKWLLDYVKNKSSNG